MSGVTHFPGLSETGWLTSGEQIADYMFAHFFESFYSQTQLYPGQVSSFAWAVAQKHDNPAQLATLLRSTLLTYYSRAFNDVTVEVQEGIDQNNASKAFLTVYLAFTDNEGKQHTLSKMITDLNSKTAKVISLNNTGA